MAGEDYGETGCLSCGAIIVQGISAVVLVVWFLIEAIGRFL